MSDAYDRRHRSPRHYDRDRRDHRDRGDDRYKRDDRRDDRRSHRDRDDRYRDEPRDRRRHDEDRGGYRRDSFRESRDDRRRDRHTSNDRRSPTPPNSVPLSQRRRKASGWDVTAPGYEQYSAMQAKQTGLFNLPGANRSHGPQIIGFTGAHPPVATGMVSNSNLARQSRRLYLGSITPLADEESIALFFNSQMRERKLTTSSAPPVLAVQVNREKNYAFVEFRSAEDATAGMALDGTVFLDGPLRVRRPHDYAGPEAMTGVAGFATLLPATMPDSLNKIFIGNLPTHLTEDQIVELLKSFGELKAFNLVREHGTNVSKGFAFVEYADPAVTDIATDSLNGMDLGDKKLVVQRASVGAKGGVPLPPEAMDIPAPIVAVDLNKEANGRVVLMLNMVVPEDLMDDVEYEEILDDIRGECSSFGQVLGVYVPRPLKKDKSRWDTMDPNNMSPADIAKADEIAGVGRVYVKFSDTEGATTAVRQLAGRSFAGRTIITTLMREDDPDVQRVFSES